MNRQGLWSSWERCVAGGRRRIERSFAALALAAATAAGGFGCTDNTAPSPGAPYIAIVTRFDAAPGVNLGSAYSYHVKELSGTLGVDTVITAAPTDTVILSVPPATYTVSLEGVPTKCVSQYGLTQEFIVPAKSNTTIARYFVICRPLIRLIASVEGSNRDNEYVFRVSGNGVDKAGVLQMSDGVPADTVLVEDLPAGSYDVELFNVAANCAAISPGVEHPRAEVSDSGGVDVTFRIACADAARRPKVLSVLGTYRDGVNGVVFTAADPDRDMAEYVWDVTDCRGATVIPNGSRHMRNLLQDRTAFHDTITVVAAFETGVTDPALEGRCAAVRVVDDHGNTTGVVEAPLRPSGDPRLDVTRFEAHFEPELTTLLVDLQVGTSPPLRGVFGTLRLRDGSLGQADGNQDIGIFNTVGYLDTVLPQVTVGSRFQYFDVLAVELYLFDAQANFTLLRDEQLF